MTEEREKLIEKALKLRELALRGVGGEKENAIRMFAAHKEKHGILDSELGLFRPIDNDWYHAATKTQQDSRFARWFRKSVTVYGDEPIVFYHKSRSVEPF